MTRRPRPGLKIEVLVQSDRWRDAAKAKSIVRRAVARAAAAVMPARPAELAIVLTDDSAIRLLNRDWRGIDKATNVLSFPARSVPDGPLGDIVLAFETIAHEARGERKPFDHHLAHLAVHGFLHLAGYDHERHVDALLMEQAERDILRELAIPDPYQPGPEPAKKPTPRTQLAARAPDQKPVKVGAKGDAGLRRGRTRHS